MGWLTDLAEAQGFTSLQKVAQAMKDSPRWPSGDKRSMDTVANKLRHADRGEDLGWWTDKGQAFLGALADVLHEDEEDLIEHLQREASRGAGAALTHWVFKMFPVLKPLDLIKEMPFPGVPDEMLRPGGPKATRTWWIAPSGAGKTLVGRWLELRYGWTYCRVDHWTDFKLPDDPRIFVEITSPTEYLPRALSGLPPGTRICIASTSAPPARSEPEWPASREPSKSPFEILRSPPPQTWMNALLDWIAARVKPGGGFDAKRLKHELREQYRSRLFETPGDLLEFAGLVEEIGLDELLAQSSTQNPLRWVRAWLTSASNRPDRDLPPGIEGYLADHGADLLLTMELERYRRGFGRSLTRSEWIDLVPREVQEPHKEPVPAAATVIESLEKIGALVEAEPGRMLLRPVWVANGIANIAFQQLYDAAPQGLGALLLFKETSEIALRRLIEEVHKGSFDRIKACAIADAAPSPEQLAALDGAFRVIGLALANNVPLPIEIVRAVWNAQMRFVASRYVNWPPIPIVSVAFQDYWRDATSISTWFLAAFAITRALGDAGNVLGPTEWNPWQGLPEDEPARRRCLEALVNAGSAFGADLDGSGPEPLRLAVYRLGGDLLRRQGLLRRHHVLRLQGPDLVVDLATGMEHPLESDERRQLLRLPFGLDALKEACARRRVHLPIVLAWCWRTWGADTQSWPPTEWVRDRNSPTGSQVAEADVAALWRAAPAAALSEQFCRALVHRRETWQFLTEAVWARWFDFWAADEHHSSNEAEAFRHVPTQLAINALRDGSIDKWATEIRRILWERMPREILGLVDELAASDPATHPAFQNGRKQLSNLVFAAPGECHPAFVERAGRWLESPSRYPGVGDWLRPWLMWAIEQRSPGWREAYQLALRFRNEG